MHVEDAPTFAHRPAGAGELFQFLRDGQPRSREELALLMGQARSSLSARIDLLTSLGLIGPVGGEARSGATLLPDLVFNPAAKVVLAADIGKSKARLAITDLASKVLAVRTQDISMTDGPDAVLDWVITVGRELMGAIGRPASDLVSIGIGLPTTVSRVSGQPINPPVMPAWNNIGVPKLVQDALKAPVLVDNDVNIMARGEHCSSWSGTSDMLFVKVATGIGAGIISDGELRRGALGAAGDVGHISVTSDPDVHCACGNTGCLEALASGQAIAAALSRAGLPTRSTADVVSLVHAGNAQAIAAVHEAGRTIGGTLAGCVTLLNPQAIVIGGSLATAGDHLIAGIREVVYRRALPLATQGLQIVTSRAGAQAGILGASSMAINRVLGATAIDEFAT